MENFNNGFSMELDYVEYFPLYLNDEMCKFGCGNGYAIRIIV